MTQESASQTPAVALIGVADCPELLLDALSSGEQVRLAGMADSDRSLVERVSAARGVPGFVDARRMLAELQHADTLDAVFITVGQSEAVAAMSLAIERRVNAWKLAPLAANLDTAAEWVRAFDAEGLLLRIGRPWRTHRCFEVAADWGDQLGERTLIEARTVLEHSHPLDWRRDCERAGAGALLAVGLDMIDLAVATAGIPDEVTAVTSQNASNSLGLPAEVEHTAVLLIKYDSGLIGTLMSTWATGTADRLFRLHGAEAVLELTDRHARLIGPDGKRLRARRAGAEAWREAWRRTTDNFATLLRQPPKHNADASILWNMAVIEAAYLSARTNQPESLQSVFEMHNIPRDPNE